MQLPSLRRPVGASVLAGVAGAGVVDLLVTAGHGGAGGVAALAIGLYGAAEVVAGLAADLLARAIEGARPNHWGPLRDDADRDRAVAAGILAALAGVLVVAIVAAAGQRLLIGKMQSQ